MNIETERIIIRSIQRGYVLIDNYPLYDKFEGAICFAKEL